MELHASSRIASVDKDIITSVRSFLTFSWPRQSSLECKSIVRKELIDCDINKLYVDTFINTKLLIRSYTYKSQVLTIDQSYHDAWFPLGTLAETNVKDDWWPRGSRVSWLHCDRQTIGKPCEDRSANLGKALWSEAIRYSLWHIQVHVDRWSGRWWHINASLDADMLLTTQLQCDFRSHLSL